MYREVERDKKTDCSRACVTATCGAAQGGVHRLCVPCLTAAGVNGVGVLSAINAADVARAVCAAATIYSAFPALRFA